MTPFLAQFAAGEYHRRRDALATAHAAGHISLAKANRNAQLWLAIARAAGAELPEMLVDRVFPRGSKGLMRAADIAAEADYLAELTRARDNALRKALSDQKDLRRQQFSWDMHSLAINLGCPATTQIAPIEQEAA